MQAIAEASELPLSARVAHHLEAIYTMTKASEQATVTTEATGLKEHIGEVLHKVHNGIDVRSGELMQKLEALFHKL